MVDRCGVERGDMKEDRKQRGSWGLELLQRSLI